MKLLLVCDYDLDYLGGAQTALLAQAQALVGEGHTVAVMAPRAREAGVPAGVAIINPPATVRVPRVGLPVFRRGRALRTWVQRRIRAFEADAVIVHSEFGLAAAALEAASALGIPSLHTVHTFFWRAPVAAAPAAPAIRGLYRLATGLKPERRRLADRPADSALRSMTLALAKRADAVISPSHHQAEQLRSAGAERVLVISNAATRAAHLKPLPRMSPLRLAWIGRFAPEKRLNVMLEAMELLWERQVPVLAEIAGGEVADAPANVRCLGVIEHSEVIALLHRSHCAVQTSLGFDNQPMVMLEACALARPTVVSDPVLAEEFGAAALAAEDSSAAGLARTLEQLAADPAPVIDAARAAGEYAALADPAAHAQALEAAVDELRGTGGTRRN